MRRGLRLQEIDIPERERRMKSEIKSKNPITFEIISHRLHQIAKETGNNSGAGWRDGQHNPAARLHGSALSGQRRSPERRRHDGAHAACAGFAVKRILERFENDIYPDDVSFGMTLPRGHTPV